MPAHQHTGIVKRMTASQLKVGIAVVVALSVAGLFFVFANPFIFVDQNALSQPTGNEGLVMQDESVGTGDVAEAGKTITVHYTGRLENGTVFDTSVGREPFTFMLGAGDVIAGWDQGLVGMKAGGKRLLIIPATLGYGAIEYGPIPANSTLIFEVELVSVQ